jgi:hypothetical protein
VITLAGTASKMFCGSATPSPLPSGPYERHDVGMN